MRVSRPARLPLTRVAGVSGWPGRPGSKAAGWERVLWNRGEHLEVPLPGEGRCPLHLLALLRIRTVFQELPGREGSPGGWA